MDRREIKNMTDSPDRLVLHGSFTSSSSYKPMLFLVLGGLPFSFRTVNLKNGVQKQPAHLAINRYGQVPVLQHRGLVLVMSNVILDYLSRTTGKFEGGSEQDRIHAREVPDAGHVGDGVVLPREPLAG